MKGWPAVGSVLDVDPSLAALLGIAIFAGLVGLWVKAPSIGARLAGGIGALRALSVAATGVLVGVSLFATMTPSAGPGPFWGGNDPRLIGTVLVDQVSSEYFYAYGPGAEIRHMISFGNTGSVPITVLGISHVSFNAVTDVRLRFPPGGPSLDSLPLYPTGTGSRWFSEPFAPFELAPGQQTTAALAVRLADCTGMLPVATLPPGGTLPATQSLGSGFQAVLSLTMRYSALGIERTEPVRLTSNLFVTTSGSLTCGSQP